MLQKAQSLSKEYTAFYRDILWTETHSQEHGAHITSAVLVTDTTNAIHMKGVQKPVSIFPWWVCREGHVVL